ncbi:MAG: hypothetical protein GYA02_18745 [Clostridiaceae bacterium]|nr:hypothetical protein [Clostridiaceae bacterium]
MLISKEVSKEVSKETAKEAGKHQEQRSSETSYCVKHSIGVSMPVPLLIVYARALSLA